MKLINTALVMLGFLFLAIGLVGVLVPVLPTTPFLLLASASFVKGSSKFDSWLKSTRIYKDYAEDFVKYRAMTFKRNAQIMALSDIMLLIPLIKVNNIYVRIFIAVVVIIKYWYFIFKIKTI